MKWKLTYIWPPADSRPLQTLPLLTKKISSWVKVQEWVRDNPGAEGKVWERRRTAVKGAAPTYELFCTFSKGLFR